MKQLNFQRLSLKLFISKQIQIYLYIYINIYIYLLNVHLHDNSEKESSREPSLLVTPLAFRFHWLINEYVTSNCALRYKGTYFEHSNKH